MKNEIVFERKGHAFTDSLILADKAYVQHESVVRLINNNAEDLEEFGKIEFSDLKSGKRGRPTRVYYLNERQTTLVLTYMDNTEPVKRFKKKLVHAFYEMESFKETSTNRTTYILLGGDNMAVKVTIKTSDGKVYTNPADVHIPRNEKTAMFYQLVDQYVPKEEKSGDKTA